MSIVALARRMHRMDCGRTSWARHVEQLTDVEMHAAIEQEVGKLRRWAMPSRSQRNSPRLGTSRPRQASAPYGSCLMDQANP